MYNLVHVAFRIRKMKPLRTALVFGISLLAFSAVRTGVFLTYGSAVEPSERAESPTGASWQQPPLEPVIRPPADDGLPTATRPASKPFMAAPPPTPPRADGSVEAALQMAAPGGKGSLMVLTFGDSNVQTVLQNFVEHASASGTPHVVGAVDVPMFDRLAAQGVAVYKTPLALDSSYIMDGSNSHGSKSWQRFAAMRTGDVARIVSLGYDVLHSDVDVVWLRSPLPYLRCSAADVASGAAAVGPGGARPEAAVGCATLRDADVAVSSDNMSPGDDLARGAGYAIGGTLNTGLLLIRGTAAGVVLPAGFVPVSVQCTTTPDSRWCPTPPDRIALVASGSSCVQPPGADPRRPTHNALESHRLQRFANALHSIVVSPPPGRKFAGLGCCTSDQQVFGRMVRDEGLTYPGLRIPPGQPRTVPAWNQSVHLGILPLGLFANGHHQERRRM